MKYYRIILFVCILFQFGSMQGQSYKLIEKRDNYYKIAVQFDGYFSIKDVEKDNSTYQEIVSDQLILRAPGEPMLPSYSLQLGVPAGSNIKISVLEKESDILANKFILPQPDYDINGNEIEDLNFDQSIYGSNSFYPAQIVTASEQYEFRYSTIQPIIAAPFRFNPVTRELIFYKKLVFEVRIIPERNSSNQTRIFQEDQTTDKILDDVVINPEEAKKWKSRIVSSNNRDDYYWYDPNKTYFKIYLNRKGVFRVTYDEMSGLNSFPQREIFSDEIEIYNRGEIIPLDVIDKNHDELFGTGDYFQFVGYPIEPTPYAGQNIYNLSNIYWLSFDGDTTSAIRYELKDGYPQNYSKTYQTSFETVHYEKDTLFERLGYAPDDHRDFWYWGKAEGKYGVHQTRFQERFSGFTNMNTTQNQVNLRINMHGMTKYNCSPDHHALVYITDQYIGDLFFDGQNQFTYDTTFTVADGAISIFPTGNMLQVDADGDICWWGASDNIRINWFEFDYWRDNRASGNHFFFSSPPGESGVIRYWLWQWTAPAFKVYVPQTRALISHAQILDDTEKTVLFVDTLTSKADYFCVDDFYFYSVDSIRVEENSDIRNESNGADYLIVTHKDFLEAAQDLANFRSNNLTGFASPRVKIVTVDQIYDEFSYGFLDPVAIKDFVKYTFEHWSGAAPSFLAILGDMSWDYRHIISTSRPNFVPSFPYHSWTYGLTGSDELFGAVVGDDVIPDMAVGRLSVETMEEADILLDKLKTYPSYNTKLWTQNTLLIGAGESIQDENDFGFNDDNMDLYNDYLIPNGYSADRVFLFPNRPEYEEFQGGGPEIRDAFNNGCIVSNFYGHGGGYQWDQVFLTDDIYLLDNGGKLPLVLSPTCYTAHFDNQNVFGEIFNKIPGKGSIGFWGNTGLTFYSQGLAMNKLLFYQLFTNLQRVVGNAIMSAKVLFAGTNPNRPQRDHIALLTYLGDPGLELAITSKPDFAVGTSDISMTPENPLVGDTVIVKTYLHNIGRSFRNDSVSVVIHAASTDTVYIIANEKVPNFGELDSLAFAWTPDRDGLVTFLVEVNEDFGLDEDDHSDNIAQRSFSVFDLSLPNIIKPVDGFFTDTSYVEFRAADIGYYIGQTLEYFIEIDTTLDFTNPIIKTNALYAAEGYLEYIPPPLANGIYFWRMRLYDGENYSNWDKIRSFSVSNAADGFGFKASGSQLKQFTLENVFYSDSAKSLVLNTQILPPKPMAERIIDTMYVDMPSDDFGMTTITTDGTYIYYTNMAYFNNWADSRIYKLGTGYNSTIKGYDYGSIPDFSSQIRNQIVYCQGFIYVAFGESHRLKKVDPETGQFTYVDVPDGLFNDSDGKIHDGFFYLTTDGRYVYNFAFTDSLGSNRYILRKFDPENNWERIGEDLHTASSSYEGFSGSFIADGYFYPSENLLSNYMRRIRMDDGFLELEWVIDSQEFQRYTSWCYDKEHDVVYSSIYGPGLPDKIVKFIGKYKESSGKIISPIIGPAKKWEDLTYGINKLNFHGFITPILYGYDNVDKEWKIIQRNFLTQLSLQPYDAERYTALRFELLFSDSSAGVSSPASMTGLKIDYQARPEIIIRQNDFNFDPDSLLQGYPITMSFTANNFSYGSADTVNLKFRMNEEDSPFFSANVHLKGDSSSSVQHVIQTEDLPPHTNQAVYVKAEVSEPELYTFNNLSSTTFFVARDSVKPVFNITFDGDEIFNGDMISARPEIKISLSDNSPLTLDTTNLKIYFDNELLSYKNDSINYSYIPYPDSYLSAFWKPNLENGTHLLEVSGWDASNNWFDSVSYRITFSVNTENKILDIYNYPNPFSESTNFTFVITGSEFPDELTVKIYTVAGRLIRELDIPVGDLKFGFNKFYWDGKDEDGDEIGNGVYFAKLFYHHNDKVITNVIKMARVR